MKKNLSSKVIKAMMIGLAITLGGTTAVSGVFAEDKENVVVEKQATNLKNTNFKYQDLRNDVKFFIDNNGYLYSSVWGTVIYPDRTANVELCGKIIGKETDFTQNGKISDAQGTVEKPFYGKREGNKLTILDGNDKKFYFNVNTMIDYRNYKVSNNGIKEQNTNITNKTDNSVPVITKDSIDSAFKDFPNISVDTTSFAYKKIIGTTNVNPLVIPDNKLPQGYWENAFKVMNDASEPLYLKANLFSRESAFGDLLDDNNNQYKVIYFNTYGNNDKIKGAVYAPGKNPVKINTAGTVSQVEKTSVKKENVTSLPNTDPEKYTYKVKLELTDELKGGELKVSDFVYKSSAEESNGITIEKIEGKPSAENGKKESSTSNGDLDTASGVKTIELTLKAPKGKYPKDGDKIEFSGASSNALTKLGEAIVKNQTITLTREFADPTTTTTTESTTTSTTESTTESTSETTTKTPSGGGSSIISGSGSSSNNSITTEKTSEGTTLDTNTEVTTEYFEPKELDIEEIKLPELGEPTKFTDVKEEHWATNSIEKLSSAGIITGLPNGSFEPNGKSKRADVAVMLTRLLGLNETSTATFNDVNPNSYYANAVGLLKEFGISNGDSKGNFNPEKNISRQETMTMIVRILEKIDVELNADTTVLEQYSDSANIQEYAKEPIAKLINAGIIQGNNGLINPNVDITRAEMAVILDKIYDKVQDKITEDKTETSTEV